MDRKDEKEIIDLTKSETSASGESSSTPPLDTTDCDINPRYDYVKGGFEGVVVTWHEE